MRAHRTSFENGVFPLGRVGVVRFSVNADKMGASEVERVPHVGAGPTFDRRHAEASVIPVTRASTTKRTKQKHQAVTHTRVRREVLEAVRAEEITKAVACRFVIAGHCHVRLQRCDRLNLISPLVPRLVIVFRRQAIVCGTADEFPRTHTHKHAHMRETYPRLYSGYRHHKPQ